MALALQGTRGSANVQMQVCRKPGPMISHETLLWTHMAALGRAAGDSAAPKPMCGECPREPCQTRPSARPLLPGIRVPVSSTEDAPAPGHACPCPSAHACRPRLHPPWAVAGGEP